MKFRSGVLHGEEVTELLNYANENDFALPAVNEVNTSSVNAAVSYTHLTLPTSDLV